MADDAALRELRSRLPGVSETIIQHFLSKNGNVEECYEQLREKGHQQPISPQDRPFIFPTTQTNDASPPLNRGISYPIDGQPPNNRLRAQHSVGSLDTLWDSNESTPHRPLAHSPRTGHRLSSGSEYAGHMYETSPSRRGSNIPELVQAQKQALDHIVKIRDHHVSELSKLRAEIQRTKEELSELRVKVSEEGSWREDMEQTQDVITTIRFDINEKRKQIAMWKSQAEMKSSRDVYTEEGIRWQCSVCGFLNHPLLPNCENCSRRSR